jgi:DNA-binding MarR family transcriptional regulator
MRNLKPWTRVIKCDRFHTGIDSDCAIIAFVQLSAPSKAAHSAEPAELARGLAGFMRFFTHASDGDFLRQADELDLSLTQLKLLSHLYELPEPVEGSEPKLLSVKDVAEELGISLPAASRAIDPLVKRRLVARHEDALDRRVKRVRLTARGESAVGRLLATRIAAAEAMLTGFTESERRKLAAALGDILSRPEIKRYCPRKAG